MSPGGQRCVGFRGVDWEVEAEKTQQSFERRKEQQKRRFHRKTQASNEQELKTFLQFVVSSEETAEEDPISQMGFCSLLLGEVEEIGVATLPTESSNVDKVKQLLDTFDSWKDNKSLCLLVESWMESAVTKGIYSKQPKAPSSPSNKSTVSGMSDWTLETISLESYNITNAVAEEIIRAAVFAAYAVGKQYNLSHERLFKKFGKIFRFEKAECIKAMYIAGEKTDWPEFSDEEASAGSHSSKSLVDELSAVAYSAIAQNSNDFELTESQINAINEYYFRNL